MTNAKGDLYPNQMLRILTRSITIGIRREAKNRWERRVPLLPDKVESLIHLGHQILLQPSTKRVIPDEKYLQIGARIQEDLGECDVILGVKEVPIKDLIPSKTYLFFSHTHKGQPANMKMLGEIVDRKIRLLDYELLTDNEHKRIVQFSRFAGYAGMVDGLHTLGHVLLARFLKD
jgi:alpha-aminoadipic semialdehyde synthase